MIATAMRVSTIDGANAREVDVGRSDPFTGAARADLERAFHLAWLVLGNLDDAQDAVGAALERAWARRGQIRDRSAFQPWFDRIVVNICRDVLRRRGKVRFIALDAAAERQGVDPFAPTLEQDALLRAVARLGAEERIVTVLHFWADLSLEAIAERCAAPVGTVKSRLHRALDALRRDPELRLEEDAP